MDYDCPNCHESVDRYNWSAAAHLCKPCLEQVEICAPFLLEDCEAALSFLLTNPAPSENARQDLIAKLLAGIETARNRKG